jgi:hypothetical protein
MSRSAVMGSSPADFLRPSERQESALRSHPSGKSRRSALHTRRGHSRNDTIPFETWVRVIRTLASRRERGELGQGRVRSARSAAWMSLTKTGRSPGITETASAGNIALTWPDLASVRGRPSNSRPMMGSEGPAVQAHSTWFTEQPAVRRHRDRDGLDRSRRPARSCAAVAGESGVAQRVDDKIRGGSV